MSGEQSQTLYAKAKTPYDSAAAVIVMAANYHSVEADHDTVVQNLNINSETGAGKENIRGLMNIAGFQFREFYKKGRESDKSKADPNTGIEQLIKHLDERKPIIANLSDGKGEGKYVLVHSHDGQNILYHDPDKGPDQKLSYAEFDKKWSSPDKQWEKWYMIVDKHGVEEEHQLYKDAQLQDGDRKERPHSKPDNAGKKHKRQEPKEEFEPADMII